VTGGYLESRKGTAGPFSPQIDRLFEKWDHDRSPGVLLAVTRGGVLLHQRGYGVANIEDDTPFSEDTVLRLGSTSKHLCATCILILENRGLLSLDDDIRRWVPELPDFGEPITLRHLLTMTSGLPDGINMLLFGGLDSSHALDRKQAMRLYCSSSRLMFRPGDDWSYSNTNYSLLTLVIERISGLDLSEFMQQELFGPLGMSRSQLTPWMDECVEGKARGYEPAPDGGFRTGFMRMELDGNGGVDSTVNDMLKWLANYREDRHFGPDYRARMEAENRLNDGRLLDYRLGIEVKDYRGFQVVRHAGGMPGYLCDFVYFPDPDLGIVLFANVLDPDILTLPDRVANIVLESEFPQPRSSMTVDARASDASGLTGVYAGFEEGLVVEIAERDGSLICYWLGDLNPLHEKDGWLHSRKSTLAVRATNDGLEFRTGCAPARRLQRVAGPGAFRASDDAGDDLSVYEGRYLQPELEEIHVISRTENGLKVSLPSPMRRLVWNDLVRIRGDFFVAQVEGEPSCTNVTVRFLRDGSGGVSGLSYSINRCRDIVFQRLQEMEDVHASR
jgi:CubicO group peptidase (beta-lactamase class C family)